MNLYIFFFRKFFIFIFCISSLFFEFMCIVFFVKFVFNLILIFRFDCWSKLENLESVWREIMVFCIFKCLYIFIFCLIWIFCKYWKKIVGGIYLVERL